jgi:hypothetical protein
VFTYWPYSLASPRQHVMRIDFCLNSFLFITLMSWGTWSRVQSERNF